MKSAFIIHDSFSNPDQNWYPWLRTELEQLGYSVFTPKFPTPEHQSLEQWLAVFEPYRSNISDTSIFIGHGTGCAFILRLLENSIPTIRAGFFVAPFVSELPHQALQLASATFTSVPFSWKVIHEHAPILISFASTNDPFVPLSISVQASELLGTPLVTIPESEHFSDPLGTMELPLLLEKIVNLDTVQPNEDEVATKLLQNELQQAGISVPHETSIPTTDTEHQLLERDDSFFLDHKELEPISTYYRDITHMLNTAETKDMAAILRAEREQEALALKTRKQIFINVFYIFCTLVLLIGTAIVIKKLGVQKDPIVPTEVTHHYQPSLIFTDTQIPLSLDTDSLFTMRDTLANLTRTTSVAPRTIYQLHPYVSVGGTTHEATLTSLFKKLELKTPSSLIETLDGTYVYGLYGGNVPRPFLLMHLSSFDRAFTGMRDWEKSLAQDMQDLLGIDPSFVRPSLYDRTFIDKTIDNYPVRVLYAPRYTRETHTEYSEELLPPPPARHVLSPNTLSSIETITDTSIVFRETSDFLKTLSIGDIIVSTGTTAEHPAFLRKIVGFSLDGGKLVIATHDATVRDAIVQTPPGTDVHVRQSDTGSLEYYTTTEHLVSTDIEGASELVLLYTFLNDTTLLITTNEDVITAVVERLASKERDTATGIPTPPQGQ